SVCGEQGRQRYRHWVLGSSSPVREARPLRRRGLQALQPLQDLLQDGERGAMLVPPRRRRLQVLRVRGGLLQIPGKHGDVSGRRGNRGLVRSTAPPTTVVAGVGAYGDRNALVAADDRVCGAAGTGRQAAVGAACTGVADVHYPLAVGPLTCVHIGRIARSLLVVHIPLAAVRHLHVSTVTPLLRGERCTTPQGLRGCTLHPLLPVASRWRGCQCWSVPHSRMQKTPSPRSGVVVWPVRDGC